MLEKHIEKYLRDQVKASGGIAYKFTSPSRRSVPDRLCLFPGGRVVFVECKAPGKQPTAGQTREMTRLSSLGFDVQVIDSKEKVDKLVEGMR